MKSTMRSRLVSLNINVISKFNEITFGVSISADYNGFVLYVNGVNVISDIKIIDNIWHFLCGELIKLSNVPY